jgi:hypothetical protein
MLHEEKDKETCEFDKEKETCSIAQQLGDCPINCQELIKQE